MEGGDENEHSSRFEEQYPLEAVEQAVKDAPSPVALSADVVDELGCAPQTARDKLATLAMQGRVEKRETSRVTLWWPSDDEDDEEGGDE